MAHVMVVEDEPITAADLEQRLVHMGHEVSWFDSGEDALAHANVLSPDLVLMDIRLRGALDGLEAARRLREHHDVPVVFITAFSDPATVDRACDVEPYGYLLKPFTEQSVATLVKTALARVQAERTRLERERWISRALQHAGDAVLAVDEHAAIRFINGQAERLLGVRAQDLLGKDARAILGFADAGRDTPSPLDVALRGDRATSSGTCSLSCATSESALVVAYSAATVHTSQRETAGAVLVFREAEPAAGSVRPTTLVALDELSRRLAHEINNPLTYNLGALSLARQELAQLAASRSLPAEAERISAYLQSAQEGANRVAEVVRELKLFSLSERDHAPIQPAELLALAMASTKLDGAPHIRWVQRVESAPTVRGSRMQLASVLAYAIRNSVETLERRDVRDITLVTAVATEAHGWAELRVTACGPAPTPAVPSEARAAKSTTVSRKLAEQVVESHAGELVMADFPEGRAFALYLPPLDTSSELPNSRPARRGNGLELDLPSRADIALCLQTPDAG